MARDRHQLAVGEAVLGADRLYGLAQPMAGDALQPGLGAAIAKPIPEPCHREGLAELCHQEREIPARAPIDDVPQRRQDRQRHVHRLAAPALELREAQDLVGADMLAAELDDVAPALAGVEEQGQGETRLGADRVAHLERSNLRRRPGREAVALGLELADVLRGIPRRLVRLDRPGEQCPDCLEAVVGGFGRLGLAVAQRADVLRTEGPHRAVTHQPISARLQRLDEALLEAQPPHVAGALG